MELLGKKKKTYFNQDLPLPTSLASSWGSFFFRLRLYIFQLSEIYVRLLSNSGTSAQNVPRNIHTCLYTNTCTYQYTYTNMCTYMHTVIVHMHTHEYTNMHFDSCLYTMNTHSWPLHVCAQMCTYTHTCIPFTYSSLAYFTSAQLTHLFIRQVFHDLTVGQVSFSFMP